MKNNRYLTYSLILFSLFFISGESLCCANEYSGDISVLRSVLNETVDTNSFTADVDLTLDSSLSSFNAKNFMLDGSGNSIDGQSLYSGLNIGGDKTLTVENFGNYVDDYQNMKAIKNLYSNSGASFANNWGNLNVNNSVFYSNTAEHSAGVISSSGTTVIKNSSFISNKLLNSSGGTVSNYGNLTIIASKFISNTAANGAGGAIYTAGTAVISDSLFSGNKSSDIGGAILNDSSLTLSNTSFLDNASLHNEGGAINNRRELNITGNIDDLNASVFLGNSAQKSGGAIYNSDQLTINNVKFSENSSITESGGAIYNTGTGAASGSLFYKNSANINGGAISNTGSLKLINSSFIDNNAVSGRGGAIYTQSNLQVISDNYISEYTGNTASGSPEAIYLANGSDFHLSAVNDGKIIFNDKINTETNTSNIYINNSSDLSSSNYGMVVFNNTVSNASLNLFNGTMKLGLDNVLDGNSLTAYGGTIDMINNSIGTANLNSLILKNGTTTNLNIDVDLHNLLSDKLTGTNVSNENGILNINKINILSDSKETNSAISLADGEVRSHIQLSELQALSNLYKYDVSYDPNTGDMNFIKMNGGGYNTYNPKVLTQNVASAISTYSSQLQVYNEVLGRVDYFMSIPRSERILIRDINKYAYAGNESKYYTALPNELRGAVWSKQYSTFEKIPLKNGPNISNIGYGTLIGIDSKVKHFKNEQEGFLTGYLAYNGSSQNFNGVNIYQNGGVVGFGGTLFRGNFFSTITTNIGASSSAAYFSGDKNNFSTLVSGIAIKSGYNVEVPKRRVIIQPTYSMAYTFAKTFDYINENGLQITSDPLNAIQVSPGIKILVNTKSGWQPYLGTNFVYNVLDSNRFYANDVQLPQMSVKPYIEYGFGLQRRNQSRLLGYLECLVRNGGRTGVSLQFGFRYAL